MEKYLYESIEYSSYGCANNLCYGFVNNSPQVIQHMSTCVHESLISEVARYIWSLLLESKRSGIEYGASI